MSFLGLLNSRVNVGYYTPTEDDYGGVTHVWTTRYPRMKCRIQAVSGREQVLYKSEKTLVTHKLFCEGDKTITTKDKILFGSREFDIILVRNIDELGHHKEIEMLETT